MNTLFSLRQLSLAVLCALQPLAWLRADMFFYRDGRVLSGEVKREKLETHNKSPVKVWDVEVEQGVFVRIYESELKLNGHEPLSESRTQYQKNVGTLEQSIESHAALAGECMKQGLSDLARAHFLRILDFDPQNRPARIATGYSQDINGRWVKKEVVMGENRGKVFYKGRWKFPEMLAIEEVQEATRQKATAASRDLHRWHNTAMTARGTRLEEAIQGIQQIKDPLTIKTLAEFLLEKTRPAPPELKLLYVQLLSQFDSYDAAHALATASMLDPNDQVRIACLTALSRRGREVAIPVYLGFLRSKNNAQINYAADALVQMRAENVFFPLLDVLVTKHIQESGGAGINASPTSGSFSVGGNKPVEMEINNQSVLSALSALTGQSFGYDRAAWIAWYASVHAQPAGDLRRDP